MATDLLLKVKFAAVDQLSRVLLGMNGASKKAGRALAETNKTLRQQKDELRAVQKELGATSGDLTKLQGRERELEAAIAGSNKQLEQRKRLVAIDGRTQRLASYGQNMIAQGQSTIMWASMVAGPLMQAARAGAEFNSLKSRMGVLGLGDRAVSDLTAFAKAMDVAGSSVNENMRYLLEAQGVFREGGANNLAEQLAGAKLMGPLLAKMSVTAKGLGKEIDEEQERYFLRFIEQAGGLTSPKRAAQLTDGLFRALQSSGGNVQASNYQSFMARAGIAGTHLSERSLFADFEPLIGELHEQAGTGLATAFKMATGIKANSRAAAEFLKMGLWDRSKINFNSLGGVKSTNGNPLNARAAALLAHDPVEFYRQIVLPAYGRNGINTSEDRAFQNARLFGGTGGNLFNLIDKQLGTILRSRGAYAHTQGLQTAYDQTKDSFFGQQGKLRAAYQNFLVAAGTKGGLLDGVTSLLREATSALKTFTALGNAHPTAFRWIGILLTNLIAMRVLLGAAQIAFGGLLGPLARVWGLFSRLRMVFEGAGLVARLGALIGPLRALGSAIGWLGPLAVTWLGRLSLAFLTNPFVLIGAGIAVAAYLIYRNWDTIKKAFGSALAYLGGLWQRFKTIGGQILDGLLGGITGGLDALKKGIFGLGEKVVGWFKTKLGIRSPSRVFAGLGGHIAGGLAIGIDRGAHAPIRRTRELAAQLSSALAMGAATPALALGGGGAPAIVHHHQYHVTIHVAGGADPKAHAREIMRELEQLQASKHRASYRDDD